MTWIGSPANVSAITRWTVMLSSARRSVRMSPATSGYRPAGCGATVAPLGWRPRTRSYPGPDVRGNVVDDLLHGRAGQEDALDAHRVQFGNVDVGNDAADDDLYVIQAFFLEQLHDPRADVHVRAGQNRQSDYVRVFLQRRGHDLLGRLAQPGVNDFHAGVAQRARDHLGAAIVPVKPRLRNDDSNFLTHQITRSPDHQLIR